MTSNQIEQILSELRGATDFCTLWPAILAALTILEVTIDDPDQKKMIQAIIEKGNELYNTLCK